MVHLRLAALLLSITGQALRRGLKGVSDRNLTGDWSTSYTTVRGCKCKASSTCDADIGTGYKCDTCRTEGSCGTFSLLGRWDYCDYRPATVESFISRSFQSKMEYFWKKVVANTTSYPEYPLLSNILSSVRTSFDNYRPEMPSKREKMIHSVGSVCQFDLDISSNSPFTGLLSPGLKTGLVRMGGAVDADGTPGLTPGLGFKLPRSGRPDGDFVMLYALSPGDSWDFFKLNQSNHIAPATGVTKVLASKFLDASQCPYHIGISDLARYDQDGAESSPPKFPFKLLMIKGPSVQTGVKEKTVAAVHEELDAIPVGTTLYTVYACTRPSGTEALPSENLDACGGALLLGAIKTSSKCTTSWYGDASLHIRHQRIEEDWQLEPSFLRAESYSANDACDAQVDKDGAPPACGLDAMLNSDA